MKFIITIPSSIRIPSVEEIKKSLGKVRKAFEKIPDYESISTSATPPPDPLESGTPISGALSSAGNYTSWGVPYSNSSARGSFIDEDGNYHNFKAPPWRLSNPPKVVFEDGDNPYLVEKEIENHRRQYREWCDEFSKYEEEQAMIQLDKLEQLPPQAFCSRWPIDCGVSNATDFK